MTKGAHTCQISSQMFTFHCSLFINSLEFSKTLERDQLKNGEEEMVLGIIREIRAQILNFLAPQSGTRERKA